MRRVAQSLTCAAGFLIAMAPAMARDYGRQGAVFRIVEPDLLEVIRARLTRMQADGAIDAANRALAQRTVARVRRPAAVAGITGAREDRAWLIDPSITVDQDLRDASGRVVLARGTRVNPLDTVSLLERLVFLDGDDPAQVAWAVAHTTSAAARLILVRGAPLDLMRARQRRFFFDQDGLLTRRLGIHAVPAVVEQRGRLLAAREIALPRTGDWR